jgi:hypothetical protein
MVHCGKKPPKVNSIIRISVVNSFWSHAGSHPLALLRCSNAVVSKRIGGPPNGAHLDSTTIMRG